MSGLSTSGKSDGPNLGSPLVSIKANRKMANEVAQTATKEVRSMLQKSFAGLTRLSRIYLLRPQAQSYRSAFFAVCDLPEAAIASVIYLPE